MLTIPHLNNNYRRKSVFCSNRFNCIDDVYNFFIYICLCLQATNRFNVPINTKFFRVKCDPYTATAASSPAALSSPAQPSSLVEQSQAGAVGGATEESSKSETESGGNSQDMDSSSGVAADLEASVQIGISEQLS